MSGHAYYAAEVVPRARPPRRARRPGAAVPLGAAALCVLGLALTWAVAALVPAARVRDARALYDFTLLGRPHVDSVANTLLHLLDPLLFTVWALLLVAVALVRARPRVALAVATVMGMAPLTSEILKPLLAHSHDQVGYAYIAPASWPSGHATAAVALALCAVLVSPPRLRPAVATLGVLFAAAVCCSLLILAWHMPSDVVGGCLVASLWTALAVASIRAVEARRPARSHSARGGLRRARGGLRRRVRAMRAGVPQRL